MIFVGMVCVAILGWLTTEMLAAAEKRVMPWLLLEAGG
jgi:ABC-type nitrate/sulfonate/bicarbonate transport system permease component